MILGTFSIVARCNRSGEFGVATATAIPCVGSVLPFALEGVGAIATQAWVNVNYGYQGLELMRAGLSVKSAMESLLAEDDRRATRQIVGIDARSCYGYTGDECNDWKGHVLGEEFAVAGNILTGKRVLDNMARSFAESEGELAERLLGALEAGQSVGGDRRGKVSAALLVASPKPKIFHNIRVDSHENPVRELRRIFEECMKFEEEGDGQSTEDVRRKVARVQR